MMRDVSNYRGGLKTGPYSGLGGLSRRAVLRFEHEAIRDAMRNPECLPMETTHLLWTPEKGLEIKFDADCPFCD